MVNVRARERQRITRDLVVEHATHASIASILEVLSWLLFKLTLYHSVHKAELPTELTRVKCPIEDKALQKHKYAQVFNSGVIVFWICQLVILSYNNCVFIIQWFYEILTKLRLFFTFVENGSLESTTFFSVLCSVMSAYVQGQCARKPRLHIFRSQLT